MCNLSINYSYRSRNIVYNEYEKGEIQSNYEINSIGIIYKQYFRNSAPIGSFVEFQYTNNIVTSNFPNISYTDLESYNLNGSSMLYDGGLRIQFGYDYLFWKTMRVSWGISFGLNFIPVKYALYSSNREDDDAAIQATRQILRDTWFGINIGIGILTF